MTSLDAQLASLRLRARWARILLLAVIALCSTGLALGAVVLVGVRGYAVIQMLAFVTGLLTLLYVLISLGSALLVALWIWRAHANLRTLGLDGLNFSPSWAVLSFLVPLLNLVVPFQAMRELLNRSIGEDALFAAQSAPDVTAWWACYIPGSFIPAVLLAMKSVGPLTGMHIVTPPLADGMLFLFAIVLLAGSAFFLQRIIATVTAAQSAVTGVGDTFA